MVSPWKVGFGWRSDSISRLAIAVLGAEVQLARVGPNLPGDTPLDHDGRVGGEGPALQLVWMGDSTAAGVGASGARFAIPTRVAAGLEVPIDVIGLGVSGDRIKDVLDDQVPRLDGLQPDVVLVSIGANDATHLTPRDDFRRRYEQMLAAVPDGAVVVVLGVPDMGAPPRLAQPLRAIAGFRGRQLDTLVREAAAEAGALYVDIAGETGPTMRADTARYFAADRYHPSDDGYALWAHAVLEVLRPTLRSPQELSVADR